MGEPVPRPFHFIAGSAAIAPVLPSHEAHQREQEIVKGGDEDDLEVGHELETLPAHWHHLAESSQEPHRRHRRTDHAHASHSHDRSSEDEAGGEEEHVDGTPDSQMPRKKSSKAPAGSPRPSGSNGTLSTSSSVSGFVNGDASAMNGNSVERRKNTAHVLDAPDDDSADVAERLMGRNTFSLDVAPPEAPKEETESKGFFELPERDRRNFLLLVLLYFLQGVPMGLAAGSVPFLLKSHLSYGQIGIYSLASYPYSLKLLWSPIVDAVWSARVGRRKSWILPIQALSGLGMLWLGSRAEEMMERAGENSGAGVWGFTWWWFGLVFMCATQDIAVDGESSCGNMYRSERALT